MSESKYNPDVLSCLANLSNDEVFTPPNIVNNMLDMLPRELFENKETTFLDIGTKSGVFLREIAKRLIKGLESEIPDLQKRVDHILHKQLFGIATTELTSLVSRRTLYCSKYPNCRYSASLFDTVEGNIRFRAKKHDFVNGRCKWCGASAAQFDRDDGLESHAYEFIHTDKPQEIFNMKFDVIVGNPPYQMSTGGSKAQAVPIYNKFVEQAKKLYPNYIMMIIPDRWFAGGFGLNDFRVGMLKDKRISNIVDYPVASECFPGVDIPGGVCYFLWDRKYNDDCVVTVIVNGNSSTMKRPLLEDGCDVFIRYNESVDILKKIIRLKSDKFINLITSQKPFGLPTTFCGEKKSSHENTISVIGRNKERSYCSKKDVLSNKELINKYKVFVSAAYGERITENYFVIGNPFVGFPGEVCSETYIGIGPFKNEKECKNVCSYMRTKFFRFLVLLHKPTQHILRGVYSFVPMQDFSKPWVDEELYKKYNLTADEIKFIESMIKPME